MPEKTSRKDDFRQVAHLSSLVLMLPSSIVVGLFMGSFLDKLLDTRPWLLLLFTLLGVASGFLSLFRGLSKLGLSSEKNGPQKDAGGRQNGV